MSASSSSITLRRAEPADAAQLAELAERTFYETFGAYNRPEDMQMHALAAFGVARQSQEIQDDNMVSLLAHRDTVLLAFAQVKRGAAPDCIRQPHAIELHRFYVDAPAHGTGLAQSLMGAVFDTARDMGGRLLWLGVWERNPRAMAFYRKMGFTEVGGKDFYLGLDRQHDRVMLKAISP